MYFSILNKVVKIIKETIEKNRSHDRTLRYTRTLMRDAIYLLLK